MTKRKNKKKKSIRVVKPKKKAAKKVAKTRKQKTASFKNKRKVASKKKISKMKKRKKAVKAKRQISISIPVNFGNIPPNKQRIMVLVIAIIFIVTGMALSSFTKKDGGQVAGVSAVKEPTPMEKEIRKMTKGYPIEKMTPYIANKDPKVAAFLVAIAKKESNWGKRKPVLEGKDCYNYWGFRMKTDEMGSGGHTCFDSPREAVNIVASRIDEMVNEQNLGTPQKMVVWKCGSDCESAGGQEAADKWISDVNFYYKQFSEYL